MMPAWALNLNGSDAIGSLYFCPLCSRAELCQFLQDMDTDIPQALQDVDGQSRLDDPKAQDMEAQQVERVIKSALETWLENGCERLNAIEV